MGARRRLPLLALAILMVISAGCAGQVSGNATPEATPTAVTPTVAASPTTAPTRATATATRQPTPTAAPSPTPTADLSTPVPTMEADGDNLWAVVLGTTSAPAGWTAAPCAGDGPFLCVSNGQEDAGAAQLSLYPLETLPDFQQMLVDAGAPAPQLNLGNPAHMQAVLTALERYVEAYHTATATDRQGAYGQVRYVRLNTEPLMMGPLPGVRYGFNGINPDGTVFERWVSYAAFDGDLLYVITASYAPGAIPTFRSDAELTQFLPHLTEMAAGLRLPLPVSATNVTSVAALRNLDILRTYGGETGNPVGQVAAGETITVTGVSPTGRHWRIDCPDPDQAACWIAAMGDATDPAAR